MRTARGQRLLQSFSLKAMYFPNFFFSSSPWPLNHFSVSFLRPLCSSSTGFSNAYTSDALPYSSCKYALMSEPNRNSLSLVSHRNSLRSASTTFPRCRTVPINLPPEPNTFERCSQTPQRHCSLLVL